MLRSFDKPVGQLIEPPGSHQGRCFGPGWRLAGEGGQRRRSIHRGDRSIQAEHLRFRRKPTRSEDVFQGAVATQQISGTLWTYPASAWQPIGRIAAKSDEIWHLF